MSTTLQEPFKRGTTFAYTGYARLPAGVWSGFCQLVTAKGLLVGDITVVITPPVAPSDLSAIRLSATPVQTAAWAVGVAYGDILFRDVAGEVLATSDFSLTVAPSRTVIPAP